MFCKSKTTIRLKRGHSFLVLRPSASILNLSQVSEDSVIDFHPTTILLYLKGQVKARTKFLLEGAITELH
jgi:hypothetical protein